MPTVAELNKAISAAKNRIAELRAVVVAKSASIQTQGAQALAHAEHARESLKSTLVAELDNHAHKAQAYLNNFPPCFDTDWNIARWESYSHQAQATVPFVTVGSAFEKVQLGQQQFSLPVLAPFIGTAQTLVVTCDNASREVSLRAVQGLVERMAVMLPHAVTFTLLDPETQGMSFPMSRSLTHTRQTDLELARTLREVLEDIQRIISQQLSTEVTSFERLPNEIRASERFEIIVAANFPAEYDRRSIEYLQRISRNGPPAGKYLIVHHNTDHRLPREMSLDGFANKVSLDASLASDVDLGVATGFRWAGPATQELESIVFSGLNAAKPVQRPLTFKDFNESNPDGWWTKDASREIRVPIGSAGSNQTLELWFGASVDNRHCTHGMLTAMPGSGKTNLLHVMICGLAARYSPSELELYLVDLKDGVEFDVYRNLPHATVVSLRTSPELARNVLHELNSVRRQRNKIFQARGVVDLNSYRDAGCPDGPMARILLIVDEYHRLFKGDRSGSASDALLDLAKEGRSSGVHLFIGSQNVGAPEMLYQEAIFENMHLKSAMKVSESKVASLTGFGRTGRALVRACDVTGKIVVNDAGGAEDSNRSGMVALLEDEERVEWVEAILKHYNSNVAPPQRNQPVLINGKRQPELARNAQLRSLFRQFEQRPLAEDWQRFAQSPERLGGLGEGDWYSGERPMVCWLGKTFDIHGLAKIVVRRRAEENTLLAGDSNEGRLGVLTSAILSGFVNDPQTKTIVVDRSVAGSPWHGVLKRACERIHPFASVTFDDDTNRFEAVLEDVAEELGRRASLTEVEMMAKAPINLVINDAQQLPAIRLAENRLGVRSPGPAGTKLREILKLGPSMGIHTFVGFSDVRAVLQVFERKELVLFRHRVCFQMTEDDAWDMARSRSASMLTSAEREPVIGLYVNETRNQEQRFKPYCYFAHRADEFDNDVAAVATLLRQWG